MTTIIEEYDLIQQASDIDRRQLSGGIVHRKTEKFSSVLADGVEVVLFFKGSEEAINARFGTWGLGMSPPAEIHMTAKPLGAVVATTVNKRQVVPVPTPPAPTAIVNDEEETDQILKELADLGM